MYPMYSTLHFAGPPGDRREGRKSRSRGLASIDPKFISQVCLSFSLVVLCFKNRSIYLFDSNRKPIDTVALSVCLPCTTCPEFPWVAWS